MTVTVDARHGGASRILDDAGDLAGSDLGEEGGGALASSHSATTTDEGVADSARADIEPPGADRSL